MDNRRGNPRKNNANGRGYGPRPSQSSQHAQPGAQGTHEGDGSGRFNEPFRSGQRGRRPQAQDTESRSSQQSWESQPRGRGQHREYLGSGQQEWRPQPCDRGQHFESFGSVQQERRPDAESRSSQQFRGPQPRGRGQHREYLGSGQTERRSEPHDRGQHPESFGSGQQERRPDTESRSSQQFRGPQPRGRGQHREYLGSGQQERGGYRGRGRGKGQWQSAERDVSKDSQQSFSPKQEPGPSTTAQKSPEPDRDLPTPQPSHTSAETSRKPKGKQTRKERPGGKEPGMEMVESKLGELQVGQKTESAESVPSSSKTIATKDVCDYKIPPRKSTAVVHSNKFVMARPTVIEVNYFRLTFHKPELNIYHYDCTFKPDGPKFLLRPAFDVFRRKHFVERFPAFDGRKNVFAGGSPLPIPNGDTLRDTIEVTDDNQQNKSFDIVIKLVSHDLRLSCIREYINRGMSQAIPQDVVQSVDVAMRNALSSRFIPVGRSLFPQPRNPQDLGDGFVLWKGMFQSMIMAKDGVYLNVDVANKAFPKPQSLLDFLRNDLRCRDSEFYEGLSDFTRRGFNDYIRGLKVVYIAPHDSPIKRTYPIKGLANNAYQTKFRQGDDGPEISVFDYFKDVKRINIKYPKLPLLHVNNNKNTMLPLEFCYVKGDQVVMRKMNDFQTREMIRHTATSTDDRKRTIMASITDARHNEDPALQEFQIEVSTGFEKVNAVQLKEPSIKYKEGIAKVTNGVWWAQPFLISPGLTEWAILVADDKLDSRNVNKLIEHLRSGGDELGIPVSAPRRNVYIRIRSEKDIETELRNLEKQIPNLQLVVAIMSPNPRELYKYIKRASELRTGVLTQCLKSKTVAQRNSTMTAKNILMKINAKVHGINHTIAPGLRPKILDEHVMFVGADVTHPAPGAEGSVSIAAVAASHDLNGFKYGMQYRLQPPKREMIDDLQTIIKEQLRLFEKETGVQPTKLLYYRDGVSEGQFSEVLNTELSALKAACSLVYPKNPPKVSFLVVQKRHHTRFFPDKRDGDGSKNNNVRAGTLVDTKITHPTELDFYLVSHQSIQGTAKPTKYHLLWDENAMDDEEVEVLTYYLCHMFARCTRSVSYPAPTYYAHLAAFRGRAYWDGQRISMGNLSQEQKDKGSIVPNILMRNPMHFV